MSAVQSHPLQSATTVTAHPCVAQGLRNGVFACIGDRAITVAEVDQAAGHTLHEALEQVYNQRTLALYEVISKHLLEQEAKANHLSVDELLEQKVYAIVTPPTDAEVNAFLKERTGNATPDPVRAKQAGLYLNLKRRADRKREYIEALFHPYNVRVSLEVPPPPVAEEIRGPLQPALGAPQGAVTLVVFSDYLCPYCRELSHTLKDILKRYPKDLRVVFRQFPIHPQADRFAQAALCADEQGHFASYHNLLFERSTLTTDDLSPLAQEGGLDRTAFDACLDSQRFATRVTDDLSEGKRLGIAGTPTLFLNGIRLEGNQSGATLSARIATALNPKTALAAASPTSTP